VLPVEGPRSAGRNDFRLYRRSPRPINIVAHAAITRIIILYVSSKCVRKRARRDQSSPRYHDDAVSAC
jgi:hypothetical protein